MKVLYYDCYHGNSEQLQLGAFIDLGVPINYLMVQFEKLGITSAWVHAQSSTAKGISGVACQLIKDKEVKISKGLVDKEILYSKYLSVIKESGLQEAIKVLVIEVWKEMYEKECSTLLEEEEIIERLLYTTAIVSSIEYLHIDRIIASIPQQDAYKTNLVVNTLQDVLIEYYTDSPLFDIKHVGCGVEKTVEESTYALSVYLAEQSIKDSLLERKESMLNKN